MTKQEKLAVKSSLLSIKDSLFSDAWEDIVSDHPYVEQDNDDIEDDVLVFVDTSNQDRHKLGMEKIIARASKVNDIQLDELIKGMSDMWGIGKSIQRLLGCAIGMESRLGFYVTASTTFLYLDGSIHGNIVVTNGDKDEAAYLRHIGYRSLIELWDQYLINNQ